MKRPRSWRKTRSRKLKINKTDHPKPKIATRIRKRTPQAKLSKSLPMKLRID